MTLTGHLFENVTRLATDQRWSDQKEKAKNRMTNDRRHRCWSVTRIGLEKSEKVLYTVSIAIETWHVSGDSLSRWFEGLQLLLQRRMKSMMNYFLRDVRGFADHFHRSLSLFLVWRVFFFLSKIIFSHGMASISSLSLSLSLFFCSDAIIVWPISSRPMVNIKPSFDN